jgi:hypothetical protein
MIMTSNSVPTPEQLSAKLEAGRSTTPPMFPVNWQASFVLSPFGDGAVPPMMNNYDQLVIANITCYYDPLVGSAMRVGLYLLEDLQYFDFVFVDSGQWYWLNNAPGEEPTDYYGPFYTSLQAPTVGLLNQAVYGGQWPLAGTTTDGWMVPTVDPNDPPHGNWISLRSSDQALWRIVNLDSDNPMNLPILGSYFMANTSNYTTFTPPPGVLLPPTLQALLKRPPKAQLSPPSPMVTQRDIQTAMANPLFSAPCTLEQIQALVPGITQPPNPMLPLPQWTNQVYISGWSLGYDSYPYPTQVWYDYNIPCQRSEFDGFGDNLGNNTPNVRQDTVLYGSYFDTPNYQWQNGAWQFNCCDPRFDGVGVPRPDFLASSNGTIKATIVGNPSFGLSSDQTLLITRATMPREADPKLGPVLSVFWLWFMADWQGVFFSECNYIDSASAHALFTIDYGQFVQNAVIDPATAFVDPCAQTNPPTCPDNLQAQQRRKTRRAPLIVAPSAKT